ncbi:hypothetical protein ALC57_06459, partial [Trachymyrmex cornetzi]
KMSVNQYNEWLLECINIIYQDAQKRRKDEILANTAVIVCAMKLRKKKRRCWISEIFKNRQRHGFYHVILPIVRLKDLRFKNYTRMTTTQFEKLLSIVGSSLKRQHVVREPINKEQRLILTLRYIHIYKFRN